MNNVYEERKRKLVGFYEDNNRLPSYDEMLGLFSLKSKNTVAYLVNKFTKDGLVEKDSKGKIVPKNLSGNIKILGTVEAGFPSPAEEELADAITLDRYLINKKEATFILKVSGESMSGAGINPGDLVLVEKGRPPRHGDIVIAEIDQEWTMKYYEKRNNQIVLVPANPRFKPILPKESLRLAGVVIGVIRKYY